jgi:hypothetical protein
MEQSFTIDGSQMRWLREMAAAHELEDEHKALRVLLTYAMLDGDEEAIFRQIRCRNCG